LRALEEKKLLQSELVDGRKFAEKNFEVITSIEGVHSWKLVCADESKISVEFILGSVPELNFRSDFRVTPSGQVICQTSAATDYNLEAKQMIFTSSVKSFFADKVHALRRDLTTTPLKSTLGICTAIHHIEWYLGRLDIIGKELSMLEVRYSGSLQRTKDSSSYQLELLIKNKSTGNAVQTLFEIGDSYPFAGLDVDISGEVDIDALERHLTKNAKPGFGYLSRACDVIAAFQGS